MNKPTSFRTDKGKVVDRPACSFGREDWISNNKEEVDVAIPEAGGLVSHACRLDGEPNGQHYTLGASRDCGFHNAGATPDAFRECTPGQTVTLSCTATGSATQVVRVCEGSHTVGGAIDCMSAAPNATRKPSDAMAQTVLAPSTPTQVKFTCPAARDKKELGGRYSLYSGSFVAGDAAQTITCEPVN